MQGTSALKKNIRRAIGASLAVAGVALSPSTGVAQSAPTNHFQWTKMEGQANDIGVARDHIIWIVNNSTQPNGEYQLYTWNAGPKSWVDQKITGVRLFAESGSDVPWVMKQNGEMWRRHKNVWQREFAVTGLTAFSSNGVNSMAILPEGRGRQFMIGNDNTGLPGGVWQYNENGNGWTSLNNQMRMKRIANDRFGNVWAIDETNYVWQYRQEMGSWEKFGGQMGTAVAVGGTYSGGPAGVVVYLVGMDKMLYKLIDGAFVKALGGGANLKEIASDEAGDVWAVTNDRQIFKGTQVKH